MEFARKSRSGNTAPCLIGRMPKKKFHDLLMAALLLALVALLGGAAYLLAPLLRPNADVAAPLSDCDLNAGPCRAGLPGGGTVELSLSPRPIPSLAPLQLEVKTEGMVADRVEVDLAGVDMNMGYNRPQLAPTTEPGRFFAPASLPVCTTGTMTWQVTVLIRSDGRSLALPFRFRSGGPRQP